MSKANQLREALRNHKNRLPYADALEIVGSRGGMFNMIKTGEIEVIEDDDGKFVTLDPDFKTKRALPIKRPQKSKRAKGSKKKHAKAPRQARPFKALAEKHAEPAASITKLALDNLIASAENLAATLRREVEGVENNPNLIAAIEYQERAAQLARAA